MTLQKISHYRLMRKLGEGGMGDVYLAHDEHLNRYVAVKILPSHYTHDEQRLLRFRQEAQLASVLTHPNVLVIHEIGQEGAAHFIVSEYIDGETLRQRVTRGPLPVAEAVGIAIAILEALSAAHDYWIVHRDIKPENVMLRKDGYVKVVDFGLAKLTESALLNPAEPGGIVKTLPGAVPGSLAYVAPERLRGEAADPRSDLFSVGAVLWEMLAGRPPFDTATGGFAIIASILGDEPPALATLRNDIPQPLQATIERLLRKNPAERFQTAHEALAELREVHQDLMFEETKRRRAARSAE
ncbi:MAG: serine/threonine-protein kinase [Thermoanaerobaculia bacterium]